MRTTATPGARSTLVVEVEASADEVRRAIDEAVRHLARRTRVPGFRPGKVPRPMLERALGVRREVPGGPDPVYDEAREHLYERTVIGALEETGREVLEIPREPEWLSFEEGQGASYRVSVVLRPQVALGDYQDYPFTPEVEPASDERVAAVLDQLRDQHASLVPVEDRGAEEGDFAVIAFEGRRDGQPLEGAQAERFPLVIGRERMVPGFEQNLLGMREGEERTFSVTFPEDYGEAELAGQEVEFRASVLELRERRLPELDDDFVALIGPYPGLDALREEVRQRLHRSSLDRARHAFADRIIEYATGNASVEIPDLLVDRELEVMVDELKVRLARQGIGFDDYLRVTERDEAAVRTEYREGAEHRVKVLLVLGAVAEKEAVSVPEALVDAEVRRVQETEGPRSELATYLASDRGRSYIQSQLRRSQTVEMLVDRWIEQHPQFADVQHAEDAPDTAGRGLEILDQHDEDDEDDEDAAEGEALAAGPAAAGGAQS
jgi:trigger factor